MKNVIETIRGIEPIKYEKDFMKVKFESDNNFPLGKILNIPVCIIIVKSVLQENEKYYQEFFLKECFFEYENNDDSYVVCQLTILQTKF